MLSAARLSSLFLTGKPTKPKGKDYLALTADYTQSRNTNCLKEIRVY
jgi:hypothetical protein